jgi:hypothetical protein
MNTFEILYPSGIRIVFPAGSEQNLRVSNVVIVIAVIGRRSRSKKLN